MFKFKSECLIFAIIFNVYHYVNFCVCFVFVFWYDLLVKIVVVNFFNFFWFFCWQKLIHTVLYILRVTHKTSHSNQCASGSVVEHLLAKEGAAGSIPVSRFFFCPYLKGFSCIWNRLRCILRCIKSNRYLGAPFTDAPFLIYLQTFVFTLYTQQSYPIIW